MLAASSAARCIPDDISLVTVLCSSMAAAVDVTYSFTLWIAFIPFKWKARHEPGPTADSFIDRMIDGPMAVWIHTHLVRDVPGGVETIDRVQYEHKPGIMGLFTRLFFDGLPLRFLFLYRHFRTRSAILKYPATVNTGGTA